MYKKLFTIILSTTVGASTALAGAMGQQQPDWTWIGTLSVGPVWEHGGKTQTFYLAREIEKTYAADQSTNVLFNGEFFLGEQKTFTSMLQGQLGLAIATNSKAPLTGIIWDDATPEFNNYSYKYKIQHTHIAAKGKLLADRSYWLTPWVSASLGVGFNNTHQFYNTPIIFEAVYTPDFASNTQTTFTYTVGAGVQRTLSEHWQAGIGYEFADWGKSSLGRAETQTLNNGITLNHLYTNGVLFNLTYVS